MGRAQTQLAHLPAPHAIGAAGKKGLIERKGLLPAIAFAAVGPSGAGVGMKSQLRSAVVDMMPVIHFPFDKTPKRTLIELLNEPEKRTGRLAAQRQEIGVPAVLMDGLIDQLMAEDQTAFEGQVQGRIFDEVVIEAVGLIEIGIFYIEGPP